MRLSNKIVGLHFAPFSEMVKNRYCRSKKNVNYHNILLYRQNDQSWSVLLCRSEKNWAIMKRYLIKYPKSL